MLGFFINLKDKELDVVTATVSYSEKVPIYEKPNENSNIITKLNGQTCLTCNLYEDRTEFIGDFIKVELSESKRGYIRKKDCFYDTLCLTDIQNEKRKRMCETALKYLGVSYDNMHCNDLVQYAFTSINIDYRGKKVVEYNNDAVGIKISQKDIQPGDLIFYRNVQGNVNDGHIGLYLGQDYIIQSTVDQGTEYPAGGVRITKLNFREPPTNFRSPFLDEVKTNNISTENSFDNIVEIYYT